MKTKLIIVDVSNFIFRAFYAIRPLHSPEGIPINAVHGVLSMMLKLFSQHRPTHLFLAKDTSGGSFRNELYPEYKANRSAPPEELVPQFSIIQSLIEKMQLAYFAHENFEADDIIGSACVQWKDSFDEILIASGDKDLMQFVDGNVKMLDTMKDKIYETEDVFIKMGVYPHQIVDYLSMVGDSSDNIPGMKGIGAKGAAKLLAEHGTLEKCIENSANFTGKKLTNAFTNHVEDARLSKKLAQIVVDIDLKTVPDATQYQFYPTTELTDFLQGMGFKAHLKRFEEIKRQEFLAQREDDGAEETFVNLDGESTLPLPSPYTFHHIKTKKEFDDLIKLINAGKMISLQTEFDSQEKFVQKLCGIAVSADGENAYFLSNEKLWADDILKILMQENEKEILSEHAQRDYFYSQVNNFEVKTTLFDTAQAAFVLNPSSRNNLDFLTEEFLNHTLQYNFEKKQGLFITEYDDDFKMKFTGERACSILKLSKILQEKIIENDLGKILYDIDLKIIPILAEMEMNGISINQPYFLELEDTLEKKCQAIEIKIASVTELEINLNSPKQVGVMLFEELKLPVIKKTKTGVSTDSEVLEELVNKTGHIVPKLLLEYREYGKLLSTYIKAIPKLLNPVSLKIHTHFNQHVAATGRLSSRDPNLQNIPIRSELGRLIRKGFIAAPGSLFISADYSQVELRLLAHFSHDQTMVDAFLKDEDIHTQTASEVLGIPLKDVTSEQRSNAKAVNFGLMYGQSSFGLAKQLKISRTEAKQYIENYFIKFSQVKLYLESLKQVCEKNGYAQTFHGRKRIIAEINSTNRMVKANAERMAINTPIQGTAADIVKIAMINIQQIIKDKKLKSKMILQVHDELIFETPEAELKQMKEIIRNEMEGAVKLSIPLKVQAGIGVNWYDLK